MDRLVKEGVSLQTVSLRQRHVPQREQVYLLDIIHIRQVFTKTQILRRSWIEKLSNSGYRCVNVGKMHSYPYHTPLGFHERYVVENKDRYLEERYYFDEWDKALKARGLVKQQREFYRKRRL